tara:strand:- start:202 stop:3504 length:3303 start_codon:yes stop_codon:yes gene_type:complete
MAAANKIQVGYIEPQDGAQFKVDEGTAAAPGICFVDSAATGLYSPGTGQLAFSTSSKQTALRILADGKVGIDCSPTVALEVNGTIKASAIDAPIEGTLDDWIVHAGDTNTKFGFPAVDKFSVQTNGAERFRIVSTGKISNTYDGTPSDPQYGQLELQKSGASNADPDWSYLSFHRVGHIAWQQGIDNNDFVIAKTGGVAKDTLETERLRIKSGGDVQVNGGNVHIDANGELAVFETDTNLAFTNSGKLAFDYSGNVARIRSSHNGSGTTRNLGLYIGNSQKILITSTEITAAVQLNLESAGSYIKSNQLKFNPNGTAYIDHGVVGKDITFRLSNSSALDFNAISIDSSAQQTKFGKQIVVGLQGGNDVTTIGGGSGIGAYIQLEHASSGINSKLMGNNDSYLNQFHGNLAIGEDDPDGNKLLIRAASTVGTTKGHIMLTGDGATNGEGPQIVFSESGSGSNFAGAYVGHIREGSNSTGSLVFGTRNTSGDASTVPAERIRIYSTGQILYSAASGDNTITSKRTNSAGSNGNYFFHLKAQASGGTDVGALGFHRDTNTDDSRFVVHTRNTGGSSSNAERLRINSTGKVLLGTTRTYYANDYYDDITINNSGGSGAAGGCGITMISNSASWGAVQFGDQNDDDCGYIKYDHNANKFIFGVEDGSVRFFLNKNKTWLGTTGHGDGSRSTLLDIVGANQDLSGAWAQMGLYSSDGYAQDKGGSIVFGGQDGGTARQFFAGIQGAKENGTSTNYAGNLNFFTRPSGAVPQRRLRIESWGTLTAWEGPSQHNGNPGRLASGHIMTWNSTHMSGGLAVGWYPIIHLTDGCYLLLLKTGAHSSILFTASNGYDPSNVSYINVLHYTNNRNGSYLNVDGLRATSDGVIEVHLTASSSDYFEMQAQILGPEKIGSSLGFYPTLTKQTGSPTINDTKYPLTYGTSAMQVENLRVDGSFSKAGGSFRIPHPLPALKDTKDLAHSFIEGPQCDNIYRGKIDLVDGTATVNLDSVSNMTEGTFVLLNRDVQCYTTNETGWTNIKGSVSGNTLTITAQDNSCTDTISWMVIGERQDDTIKSEKCAIADNDGNLIVEPDRFTNRGQSPDNSKPNEI